MLGLELVPTQPLDYQRHESGTISSSVKLDIFTGLVLPFTHIPNEVRNIRK